MIAMLAMSSTARARRLIPALFLLAFTLMSGGCAASWPGSGAPDTLLMHPVPDSQFTMPDGAVLPVRDWLPPDGTPPHTVVLALHGFNDSRDAWALPAPVFAAAGIAVFAPDQRGFGDTAARGTWPGTAALVDDAASMVRQLHLRYPAARLFVMGESMGGAVALDLAARADAPPVDGYVLLSPAVWGRSEQGVVLSSTLWLANGVAPGYRITASDVPVKVMASDNRDALVALVRDPLTIHNTQVAVLDGLVNLMDSAQAAAPSVHGRVLVAYGGHDMLVPAAAMGVAWAKLPADVRRALYPNGYHLLMRDRGRAAVIGDVIAWMQAPGALLPSGADVAAGAWASIHHPGGGLAF
jgi:alpha-beta hydrolase superfamily lysophospholipase